MMQQIQLPDLNNYPDVSFSVTHEQKSYVFSFRWVGTFPVIDIEYNNEYLVKGRPITTASDIIGRVKDKNKITGSIYFIHKYGETCEPLQETFARDYLLIWTT